MNEQLMTIKETSDYLNVNEKTVYRLLEKKELQGYKIGRVWRLKKEDIDKYLKKRSNKIKKGQISHE